MCQKRPGNARVLVGQGHCRHVLVPSLEQALEPTVRWVQAQLQVTDHGPGTMDQQGTQISIAALANSEQPGFASARVLSRNKSHPSRELTRVVKILRIPDRSHQRARGNGTDAGNLRQLAAGVMVSVPPLNLSFQLAYLPIQDPQLFAKSLEQPPESARQSVLTILENLRQPLGDLRDPWRDDDAKLREQAAVERTNSLTPAN